MEPRTNFVLRLGLLSAAGLGVRLLYTLTWARDVPVTGDALTYHVLAGRIATGSGFDRPAIAGIPDPLGTGPTAEHPPLFELLLAALELAGVNSVLGQKCAMCAVGALTVVLIGLVGRSAAGERAGLIAAGLAAVYPFLWVADGSLMSETQYGAFVAAIMLAGLAFARRPSLALAAALGALTALAALTRGEALLLALLLLVPLALTRPVALGRRLALAGAALVSLALVLAPWTARNALTFQDPVLISTNSNAVFAGANCRDAYEGRFIGLWQIQCYGPRPPGDESQKASEYRRRGLEYAREHSGQLPLVMIARVGRAWDVFRPGQARLYEFFEGRAHDASRLGLIFYYPVLALAVAGALILRRRRVPLLPLLAFPLLVTVTAALVYGLTRFRFAAEPALVVLAAVALDALAARLRARVSGSRAVVARSPRRAGRLAARGPRPDA